MHAGRPTGKDDPHRAAPADFRHGNIPGNNLRKNMAFPDTPGNQLCILAAKIQNQNGLMIRHRSTSRAAESALFFLEAQFTDRWLRNC